MLASACCRASLLLAVPLVCVVLLIAGLATWLPASARAAASTQALLSLTDLQPQLASTVLGALALLRTLGLGLAIASLACILLLALAGNLKRRSQLRSSSGSRPGLRALLLGEGAASALLWVTQLVLLLLACVTTTWFVGAWATSAALGAATTYSASAEAAVSRAVESAGGIVEELKGQQLAALDSAPPEVQGSDWFRGYRQSVEAFNASAVPALIGGGVAAGPEQCAPGCMSLDFLAGLAGLDSTCFCLTRQLTQLQQGLDVTRRDLVPALIGLALLYLAVSWALMHFVGAYSHTRRDLRDWLRPAAGSSYLQPGFSRVAGPAAPIDAAIDIQGLRESPKHAKAGFGLPRL